MDKLDKWLCKRKTRAGVGFGAGAGFEAGGADFGAGAGFEAGGAADLPVSELLKPENLVDCQNTRFASLLVPLCKLVEGVGVPTLIRWYMRVSRL